MAIRGCGARHGGNPEAAAGRGRHAEPIPQGSPACAPVALPAGSRPGTPGWRRVARDGDGSSPSLSRRIACILPRAGRACRRPLAAIGGRHCRDRRLHRTAAGQFVNECEKGRSGAGRRRVTLSVWQKLLLRVAQGMFPAL